MSCDSESTKFLMAVDFDCYSWNDKSFDNFFFFAVFLTKEFVVLLSGKKGVHDVHHFTVLLVIFNSAAICLYICQE